MTTPSLITLAIVTSYVAVVAFVLAFFAAAARSDTAAAAWRAQFEDVHGGGGGEWGSDFHESEIEDD